MKTVQPNVTLSQPVTTTSKPKAKLYAMVAYFILERLNHQHYCSQNQVLQHN